MSEGRELAKGLQTLLEEVQEEPRALRLLQVPPDAIEPNREQPRRVFTDDALDALVRSIARHGILQPLVVRPAAGSERYELIAGERRLRAARTLGLGAVPAIEARIPDERMLEVALVENLQRESLDPIEEAEAYKSLLERYGYTQESVAERVGRSRSTIANALRLLELPAPVKEAVAAGKVSAGHARALCGLPREDQQQELCARIEAEGLSVRETERAVQRIKGAGARDRRRASRTPAPAPYLGQIEDRLRRVLGTRVRLVQTGRANGRIVIHFHSDEEFERLLEFFS